MSSTDGVVMFRGKPVHFVQVNTEFGESSCAKCLGSIQDEVCDDLPETCRTLNVHFEEPDE